MNADQKQRAQDLIKDWHVAGGTWASAVPIVALLQELIDAPETEPVARVTGYYAGYLSIATVDGRVLPAGTALYAAPPAPSVTDEQLQAAFDRGLKAGNEQGIAQQNEIHKLHDLLAAALTPAEAPADVARDAWYGSNPPSLFQATSIYMALLEAAQNPQKLSAERILELFYEHSKPDRWPFGFARAIEREIFGGDT